MKISGYAAVFNSLSVDLGGFREIVAPGAFSDSLRRGDIRLLLQHDTNGVPLARTSTRTLRLTEDKQGLRFTADLPDSPAGRNVLEAVRRGDLNAMSFGFAVLSDSWQQQKGVTVRTLHSVDLHEVSVVAWPAYESTTAGVVVEPTVREMCERQRLATPERIAAAYPVQWRRLQEAKAR